jgi:aspartate/methionine/tyrosine aminotransferase
MFSGRLPPHLARNRLTEALDAARAAGRRIIELTLSNPTRAGFAYPLDLLSPLADPRALVYSPQPLGLLEARQAIARDYERHGLDVPADRIALTASTSDAYSILFAARESRRRDPRASPELSAVRSPHGARSRRDAAYDLEYHGSWAIDFTTVEHAITDRTRAILVVSPNNPTGSFITRDELERLSALCARRGGTSRPQRTSLRWRSWPTRCSPTTSSSPARRVRRPRVHAPRRPVVRARRIVEERRPLQVKLGWIVVSGPDPSLAPPSID